MAVAHDAVSEHEKFSAVASSSFTHTPVGTPRGVVVMIARTRPAGGSVTDYVAGVTYGGVAMTRVGGIIEDTGGENGQAYLYFLGSGIPTGAQSVVVTWGANDGTDVHVVCATVTASKDTTVIDFDGIANDQANPSRTLQYTGLTSIAYAILYSGTSTPPTAGTDCTLLADYDMPDGTYSSAAERQTTPGTADFTIAFVAASDDVAMAALAITEATAARMSQEPVEVLIFPNPKATTSQAPVEALIGPPFQEWKPSCTFWWF